MLYLSVNECLLVMAFLVPLLVWLASHPINDYICLSNDKDKENSDSLTSKQQEHGYNANYGAYIQSQGRYYN